MTINASALPLPAWRYLPGRNERHAEDAFDEAKALCLPETMDRTALQNIGWQYGLRLFDEGFYWEAHEVLEEVWQRAKPNGRERWLVQAVIHLANGALKNALGQPRAAGRLAQLADECAGRAFCREVDTVLGISAATVLRNREMIAAGECPAGLASSDET